MNRSSVPVLITWDIDPDRWATVEHREKTLTMALDLCEEYNIRSTFFFTARFANEYPTHIDRINLNGCEIGCHGLMHTDEEDYDRMPVEMQRSYLEEATQILGSVAGSTITTFRSPRVKISAITLKFLSDYGYRGDSSVCSQRIDFISSNLINPGWLFAPRYPYRPNPISAFRRGNLPIWEVPISAAVVPFISSSLKVLGLTGLKLLFLLLYRESKLTGKPIVYLAHPTEFVSVIGYKAKFKMADFSPSRVRTHGFLSRKLLYRLSGQALYNATHSLFAYISSLPEVTFLTCKEYIDRLN